MDELTSTWLFAWPWWILIGLVVGFLLLVVWSLGVMAKYGDEAREHQHRAVSRARRNGIGRPEPRSNAE